MNIKEKTGHRITKARKALGITIKELAARTKKLSPARISNWEQGTRSPGPLEAMLIADQLNVSASYILCLTDSTTGDHTLDISGKNKPHMVPLFKMHDILEATTLLEDDSADHLNERAEYIIVERYSAETLQSKLVATRVDDTSMSPVFSANDIVIIDISRIVLPGEYVVAYLTEKKQAVLRQYRESDSSLYLLQPLNNVWAPLSVTKKDDVSILGTVVEQRRYW